jgi:hypothetical protein
MYQKLSSSEDKLRMRPDFHVKSAPHECNDSMYETTLIDVKCIKSDSGVKELVNQLVVNGLNRFAGQTAVRKLFKLLNVSGTGTISQHELKSSLRFIGIWVQNECDYDELYNMLACEPTRVITYISFKAFMDAQCEFSAIIRK